MHPELFSFHFNNQQITIYTYAFCIAFGTLLAILYTKWQAKKTLKITLSNNFFYLIFVAGFIGGKIFLFLERPMYYIQNPKSVLNIFSGGFVFYGSFICTVVFVVWYLKKQKISVLPILDILAIATIIVHAIGRVGCYFAGCCFGKPTNSFLGIVFPTTNSTPVHPSQLYEVGSILLIMIGLFIIKKNKQFIGQIFLSYVLLYAIARSILEIFRGDNRGFIIEQYLSHSQFIAICLTIIVCHFYYKLNKKITIN